MDGDIMQKFLLMDEAIARLTVRVKRLEEFKGKLEYEAEEE